MRAFWVLLGEAIRDGLRRRLALGVAVSLVIGLAGAQSCSQVGLGEVSMGGQQVDPRVVAGFVAPLLYAFQALAVLVVAGFLAADHLARPLAEGSAVLWLARPVSREVWAGARLAGVLAIALGAGIVLLGGTGALLVARQGVAPLPAVTAAGAAALGALVVASLAMAASLVLGRSAVVLLVLVGLTLVVVANGFGMAVAFVHPEVEPRGLLALVDRFGPPLFTAIAAAVAAWNPHVDPHAALANALGRLALWAAVGVALLLVLFRRREIES